MDYDASRITQIPYHEGLRELLDYMRDKSFLLPEQTVNSLNSFLEGFIYGCSKARENGDRELMYDLNRYICNYYKSNASAGWVLALEENVDSEQDRYAKFWELYAEWKSSRE